MRILLVDNNPSDRELAVRVLHREYPEAELVSIITADDWARALNQNQIDLLVTDYQIGWSDGISLLKTLKKRYPDVPVIMFTATGSQEMAVEAMKQGLDDYVIKSPHHIDRLVVAARTVLERTTQRQRLATLEAERDQLFTETRAAERRARFLADASVQLAAALEYQATLRELARLVVSEFADWCFIDVPGRDGRVRRLALAHRDPAKTLLARQLQQHPASTDHPTDPAGAVLRSGKTLCLPHISTDQIAALTNTGEQWKLLQHLNMQSVIIAALQARGQILGVISLVSTDPNRRFSNEDCLLVEDLAARASLALDNARLYTAEQRQRQRTQQLQAITAALVEATTVADVATLLVERGIQSLGAASGAFLSLSDDGMVLTANHSVGVLSQLVANDVSVPLDQHSLLADLIRTTEAASIMTWEQAVARYPQLGTWNDDARFHTLVAVRIAINVANLCALVFAYDQPQLFGDQDRALLVTIAYQGAIALGRVRLFEAERQARADAEAAVQLRDQFLSVASHELRTPLTSLLGNAELIQRRIRRDNELSERNQRNLQVVVNQARHLNRLIMALLDLSRLRNGQLTLDQTVLDVRTVVQQVLEEAQPLYGGHSLQLELPETPALVFGDELRLSQVFYNLLSNAVKYSSPGSTIQIQLERGNQAVRLVISDQGIGIPAASVPNLFQRFFRASNVDSRNISGMGIGLYVVREIITMHGGTVAVESVEGQGSAFSVTLPLAHNQG